MDGKHTEPARGSRLGKLWRGAVPVGIATVAALAIGGGVDLVHRVQEDRGDKPKAKPAAKQAAGKERTSTPRYLVGVRRTGTALVVRDVRTGKDVGLPVAAPQGQRFQRISAAGDGGYVVSAARGPKVTFKRLRLEKNGHPKDLTEIPKVSVAGGSTAWSDLAVSPDGDRIAYVSYRGAAARIDVVSESTGKRTSWKTRLPARVTSLAWAGDTLSFVWNPLRKVNGKATVVRRQLRTLDTKGAGGDLKASKAVMKLPEGSQVAILSHDGRTIVAGVAKAGLLAMRSYAADTGRPAEVLWQQQTGAAPAVQLPDRPGGHLVAAGRDGRLLVSGADGRLYAKGGPAVPASDLADVAW